MIRIERLYYERRDYDISNDLFSFLMQQFPFLLSRFDINATVFFTWMLRNLGNLYILCTRYAVSSNFA